MSYGATPVPPVFHRGEHRFPQLRFAFPPRLGEPAGGIGSRIPCVRMWLREPAAEGRKRVRPEFRQPTAGPPRTCYHRLSHTSCI